MKSSSPSPKANLIDALSKEFPPNRVIMAFEHALSATIVAKNGCTYPDSRTRLAAVQLLMSYLEGRPIERQQVETLTHAADPDADLAARLKRSPALRRLVRLQLAEAEKT